MFPDSVTITKVTKVKKYFKSDSSGNLIPLTKGEVNKISPLGVGTGSNYGITIYITSAYTATSSRVEELFGGSFEWDHNPTLDQGNSVDGFAIAWGGNLALDTYSGTLHYDNGDVSATASSISPNSGIGWEFKEAINKTWPSSNWYLQSGSFLANTYQNSATGNDANVVANYLHTSSTSKVSSLGISATGGSIGWSTTTNIQRVAASTTFHY